jgi:hypothetical protein
MARTGVSYTEVAEAAVELVGQGRNPTVEQVRLLLGTGSSTTIAKYLRQWRGNQESTQSISIKENLPQEFVTLMKGLWERVVMHSEEQIASVESGYQQTIIELQQENEKYKTNNQRWQKLYNQWLIEKNQLNNEKITIEQALDLAYKENASFSTKNDALISQLKDKNERIEELNRLHKQAQENLEHYRESVREQRFLDQQQFEQQKLQLQQEIKLLKDHLTTQRDKINVLEQQYQYLQQSSSTLEKNNNQLHSELKQTIIQLKQLEKEKIEYLHASQHWQNQYKELQQIVSEKNNQLNDNQVETKLLSDKLIDMKQILNEIKEQNKILIHDKWVLAQEKAQLEGQLKQMQNMITV